MFEHSLIDLESKRQPARRRWISLPVAVALHLVAFSAFGFASYWSVGDVPAPNINDEPLTMMFELPPVPPPSGGHSAPSPAPTPQPAPAPQPTQAPTVQQPTVVPDHIEPAPPSTSTMTEVPGLPSANPPGNGDKPGIGVGPCCGSGPEIGDGPSEPLRLTAAITPPVALVKVQPRYTETARRANVQGVVVVEAVVDERGRVTDARILRGLPMGLERAAIEAIEQWRFKPAMMQDRPVKVYFTLTATFTLQR